MPATSDPASGSVTASEPISSPASVGLTYRSTRSVSPDATMCGSAMPWVNSADSSPLEAPAYSISSARVVLSTMSPPEPPTEVGNATPSSPACAARRCSERGTSPSASHCSRCGTTSRSVKSRASRRNATRSGVVQTSALTRPPAARSGCRRSRARNHSPRPLACGSCRVEAATPSPSRPWTTKLSARRFGSSTRSTSRPAVSGSSSWNRSTVEPLPQPVVGGVGADPHPDVGVAALVAAAGPGDRAERKPQVGPSARERSAVAASVRRRRVRRRRRRRRRR